MDTQYSDTTSTISMKPIERKSLTLQISDSIYKYIRLNNLKPGDKLPSERDMASMLQASRHTVREALRILEDRGVIEVQTGRGIFLKEQFGEESTTVIRLNGCSAAELQELQLTLDNRMVHNVIQYATVAQKQELIDIATEMVSMYEENIYSHTLDHSFHEKLYRCSNNKAIHQLVSSIRNLNFVEQEHSPTGNESIWLTTVPHHLALAKAIMDADETAAIQAIDAINLYVFKLRNAQ